MKLVWWQVSLYCVEAGTHGRVAGGAAQGLQLHGQPVDFTVQTRHLSVIHTTHLLKFIPFFDKVKELFGIYIIVGYIKKSPRKVSTRYCCSKYVRQKWSSSGRIVIKSQARQELIEYLASA